MNPLTADMESLIDTALKEDVQSGDITTRNIIPRDNSARGGGGGGRPMPYHTMKPGTPPAKKPRLFRVAYLSLIWFATTICALLFTAYPANASSHLTLTAPDDQNYSRDRAITPLQLPEATGGTGTLTYTLTGPGGGPGGLSFNASTRTLSGTPNRTGTTTLTYTVTDTNGDSTSVDFTVTVSDLTFVMEPENQNYTQDRAINDLQLPEGTGGTGPLVYTLTGPSGLPGGLNFTAGTRTLSGMPSTVSVTTLTYTVTDGNDASTSATFTVTVNPRLTLSHPVQLNFTQGRAINDDNPILPGAMGGTAPLVYTLTDLPPGLEFDPNTRRLSGTPGTFDRLDPPRSRLVGSPPNQTALYIVIYGVTDANGASARTSTTSEFLSIAISANLTLDGSVPDQKYTEGRPVTLQLPEATGGFGPLTYTLTAPGGLPEGLIFTPETRTLSGALVRQGLPKTLTYKVTDDNDASTSATFTVTGKAKVALDTPTKRSYTRGTAINVDHPILPGAIAGTEPLTYTLTALGGGALPVGLEFDPNTRRLSGTPDDIPGDFVLTYMVTDANGSSDNVGFRVAINPGLMLTAPANLNYTLDTEIEGLQLPVATGGTEPLRYTLTGPSGLPGGLGFDANTRTLSGTPDTPGTTILTYEVTDRNNANTSVTITVMVNPGLALNAQGDQNYTQDTAISNLQLPVATGGTMPLTYTLTGPSGGNLPTGLNFNANTRTLSGTPDTADTTVLTYTVTDGNGDSTSVDFRITVNAGLTLIALDDLNYTLDTEIDRLQLPEATGGTAPLVYTLTDLRPNLRFQASTRTLFGRAISIGTTTLTYTVTDANGDSTSMDFTVTVNPGLAPLTAPADQNYTQGNEIDSLPLPVATGGTAPLVYTLTDLPAGLAFNPQTRTLSGTPDTDGDFTLTYEVSDANGANTSVTFMVTVNDGLTLTAPADQNYTQGTAISNLQLPEATGGRAPLVYTLTSVPGLEFGADTRILSGTPSTATNTTTLTYTVTDTNNASTSVTFTVRVNASLGLDTPDDQNYTQGIAINTQLPEATGGRAPLTYTLTGPSGLPGGLGFDANTRTLSGTPSTAVNIAVRYAAVGANGADTTVGFRIIVNARLRLDTPDNQEYRLGTAISVQLPEATGGTMPLVYTLTGPSGGNLPAGLTFNANTRTLSGTPNTAGTTTLTYTVTDTNGASTNVAFTVNAGLALTAPANQNYTQGTAISNLELPVATGGTMPLVYTLTGPSGGNLPAGLTFNANTRTLSGTPDTPGTTTLTYEVTDTNGDSANATFTVTVNAGLMFVSTPGSQLYTQNTAITPLTLPEATGGTAPLTYTLTGPRGVPEGLAFNPQTRTLSGAPRAIDDTMLTYTVTDTNGASTNATFRIFVNSNLTFVSEPADQNYTQGIAIDTQLPEATGGTGTFAYTLTGQSNVPLPAGLTFNPDTRILSGTPSMTGTTTLVYSAQDTGDSSIISVGSIFNVEVHPGLEPLTAPDDQNYTQDTKIDDLQLPPAIGGTMPLTYTLTGRSNSDPSLPTGLSFDPSTRTLSGTPSTTTGTPTEFGNTELLYSVTDANGDSKSVDFRVTVNPRLALTAPDDQNYTLDTMITDLQLPAATGGTAALTYTLTNVPGGLNFDPSTRILSGTPKDIIGNFDLTYQVTDANGASTSVDFTINIGTDLTLNTPGNQNYTQGTAITVQLPEATGGTGTLTYTLTGLATNRNLPPGLIFDPGTRILSGTPSVLGETNLVYTVTEVRDSGSPTRFGRIFLVTVNPGLAPLTAPDDQNYTQDTAITNLQLPEATGGTMPLTYTLTGPSGGNLPTGLNFNANTRTLSGTPDTPGTTTLTYEVTDTNGANTSVTFMVTVNPRLALTAPADQNYTLDTEIDRLQLPIATGGTGTLTYTLTNVPGLTFTPGTRMLSGTPSTPGTTTLTYMVMDTNGDSANATFMVIVSDGLALTAPTNQNYTQDIAITALELPAATGGTTPLVYTLTGPSGGNLPAGLTFTPGTRMLSGTPSTPGTTTLTYMVMDTNGDSANATFMVIVSDGLALTAPTNQNYTEDIAISVQLPEATGGTGTLTYALTGTLPAGLTFTPGTRMLSGTPSTPGTTTLTYMVMDTNGDSANATFMVIVSDGLALTAPTNQNYTQDIAITALELPAATGGTTPLVYTLTGPSGGNLPAGLTFTPGTRMLSGTPSTPGTTTLTYMVMDTNGDSANATFMVIVSDGLALTAPTNQNYTQDIAITALELPVATGGTTPLVYTLTGPSGGNLPAGLDFDVGTRMLSGTPSTPGTTTLTYMVMDTNGDSANATFMVIVSDGLALTAPTNQNYTQDIAITALELPAATGGTTPLVYTLTGPSGGNLPAGLDFDVGTRMLSGTPSTPGTTTLTYMVMDTNGDSANATFMVIVSDGLALTAPTNQNYTQDIAITALELPAATGGTTPLVYTLTGPSGGNLPAGLTFTPGTRMLSGTPSTPGTTTLTYMVMDTNGDSANATFMVIVSDGLALTAPTNQNYTQDIAITALELPAATGGTTPLVYTLTGPSGGNLPAGLTFTPGTRMLSGTPSTPGTTTLTYTVMDTNGASTSVDFMVTVNAGLALTAPVDQNYTQDIAITALELPAATGGTTPLVYTLTGPSGGNLPAGLTFTPGTRMLSGTPSTPGTTTLTYMVMDTNGDSANATFMVIVSDGLALTAPTNQNYTQDIAITALELPAATGGTTPLVYTLTGPSGGNLPAGLTFTPGTRMLSGTPSTPGTTTLTYMVMDTNGDSANATFMVIVSDGLALTAPTNQNYTEDIAITALELPAATGGTTPLVYTLTGPSGGNLPAGLTFTPGTRMLSGTPSTPGTTTLTYMVMDTNGDSANATFMVIVSDGLALTASGNQNYTEGTEITALELPVATGGTTPLVYTLTGPSGGNLPAGLDFDVGTRMLSGTPSTPGTTTLTYMVMDTNGDSANATFMVIVSDGLALTAPTNQNYTQDIAITALELPAATGGTTPLVYTLTGPSGGNLPAGLTFTPGTRMLSGTPSTPGTTTLTYTVSDTNGASTSVDFMVTVNAGLTLDTPADQNYTEDIAISVQLPEATGGTGTLTYALTGTLPTGLTFTPGTRMLSGTPSTPGTTTLTYMVMDTNGDSANATFMVIVSDGLALTAPTNQNYTQDIAITALELPAATGGTTPLVYTLTGPSGGNLPAGLTFTPGTRMLSGTPSTPGTTTLTYMVMDTNGDSANATFMVIVSDGLALTAPTNQNYTQDIAITALELPAATGGTTPLVYTLTGPSGGNLPAGLTFTPGTRMLSGTPSTPGTTTLTYTVSDTNGASTSVDFMVTVNAGLTLDTPADQNYTEDIAISVQLPEATGGTGTLTYALTGTLPTGLSFNASTRTLSGTPSTATSTTTLTYTVTDTNGASTSVDFMVTVNAGLALTAPDDQNYTQDIAITGLELPAATGGTTPLVYTLTGPSGGNLPAGLTFTPGTRMLSGTPSTPGTTTLTYMVMDTNGDSANATFMVIVSDGLALTAPTNQNYTQDIAITALELPAATGGTTPLVYTLTGPSGGNLPAGLTFTPGTRMLSGTPSTPGTTTLTYMVMDTNGDSANATFMVIVSDGLALTAPTNQNYTQDIAITALELPAATGGTTPLVYTLTGPSGGNLPAGLTFTPGTRMLSGTPSTPGTTTLTYMVMDTNGDSANATFMVIVSDGLALTAPTNQNYTEGTEITALELPVATGGTTPLVYTLTGPSGGNLPAGLDFDVGTRMLSGTPSTPGTTTLTYMVMDTNGDSANATFMVIVSDGLALTAPDDQNYTQDIAITALELPVATGGTTPLVYTLTGPSGGNLPAGLTFTPGTRMLSGTPSTPGTTTLTYMVMDTNGDSANATFMVIVSDGLALTASGNQNYTQDIAITALELPAATGGTTPLVYTLTGPSGGNLPAGLTFTPGTRMLSGTPSTPGTTTLTYMVMDTNGDSANATFMVIVSDGLALTAPDDQNYTQDIAITGLELPAATGGTGTLTYTLTGPGGGNLPGGLDFDPGTRMLSGTPDTPGTTTLTYEVTDTNGATTSVDFMVIVSDGLALTASGNQNYTEGTEITALELPVATGGTTPLVYTLTGPSGGNLPAGLDFDVGTRMLSGTPSTPGTTTLTYMVMDTNGDSANATFMVIVSDGLALTAPTNQNYTQDIAITALELPAATGGTTPLVYTLTGPSGGNLPAGLTFTPGTRMLSGTPSTPGTTTLTYMVMDTNGDSANATFMVIVSDGLALTAPTNQNYTQDIAITALELPAATGGTTPLVYTLTGPSGGNLPAGLTFTPGTRMLSGTPSTPGTTTLTYMVMDTNGDSANATFMVIVSDGLALTASGNQNYTQDIAITALELPAATGGTTPLVYTLTGPSGGNLPAGLTFTPGTRMLSGTPSTPGTTTLTYMVMDTNGDSANATFMVIVSDGLALTAPTNQNYTEDIAISVQLPEATGGTGTLTYALTGTLPAGLTFTPGTRMLSGTPSTPGTTTLTYMVMDTNGDSANATFMVIVSDGLALTAPTNQNYTQDIAITALELPAATGGTTPLVYTLTGPSGGNLPAGLTFTPGTRMLSGTPSTPGTTTLTYMVMDTNGDSANATFMVIVSDGLALTAPTNQNYTQDIAITALELPAATGGTTPLVYTLTGPSGGNLPAGLTFTPGTRMLSGTPSTPGTTTLTYMVMDTNGDSANATFMVIVSDGLALTAPTNQNYTEGTEITALELPVATGGTTPLVYTLTGPSGGNLPAGLTFTPGTRMLSGTPSTPGTTTLTYMVMDTNGDSANATFMVIVSDGLALTASGNQNYTEGTEITALELPVATGGTTPLVYTLTGPSGGNLPAGLTFTPGTRMLSGTPSTPGTTTLTYMVMDTNGDSANATFMVIVSDGLALTAPTNQNYTQDIAITALELPAATGGTTPLVYTLTGPSGGNLPAGLTFTPGTRMLSGTPSTPGTTTLTYMVMDTNGDSANATFMVIVSDGLALTAPTNQNYTEDIAISVQLPEATGGTGTLTYALTGTLPAGLTFTPGTRMLSGTPSTPGTTTLTYMVMDTNGDSANATFMVIVSDGLALTAPTNQNYTQDIAITALELPAATGGTTPLVYTLTGPSGGNLPAGLTFTPGTRMLSGTPSTPGTTTLTYMVMDTNGDSANATFMVIVSDGLALTAPTNQNYTQDIAITALELPVATGGTTPLVYTLTGPSGGNLPAGLDFDVGTRMLSGTPSTPGTTTLTYMVMDTNGDSANATFMVIVSDGLALTAPTNQNYTQDIAITALELPAATGGTTPLVYTLTGPSGGNLPAGLTFTPGTRMLSGTPSTPGTTTLTYMVMDTNGDSANATFMVIVSDGLALTAPTNQNYTQDIAITALELPAATGGTTPLVYTLTGPSGGNLPAGLTFTPGTRMLSGTPSTPGTTTLTYTVSDTNGASTSVDFMVTVNAGLTLDTPADQNYTEDIAISVQLPEATGGTGTLTYALTGTLPTGLSFNASTRTLSGTPSTATSTTTLTYTVTDTNGASTSVDFMVTVNAGLALTAPVDQNYTQDIAITALELPAATGGTTPLVYTLTGPSGGNLPAGLTFTPGTRMLSGTPSTPGTTTLTYMVMDTNGDSANATFMVIVSDGLALTAPTNQNYTQDIAITALELPAATGGTTPLVYTLTGPSGGNLPAGLTFTPGTRMLSGTPSTPGTTTLTYMVMDTNGDSANATFMVIVSDGLALTAPTNQNYTEDIAITALELPAATGGTTPLVYTLTGPSGGNLPAGLTFTPGTRMLSGTPSTPGTTTLTYMVMDTNGDSANATFMVIVSDGLALTAPTNQNYTQDIAITALELPAATGGTTPLVYTLTGPSGGNLPAGLTFTPGTRMLSGTPSTPGTTTLTYMVMDTNGDSANATFTVMVNAGLALTASGNQNYTRGTAISNLILPAATGGTGTLVYTLTGTLPTGLSFTAGTRTLSGTPSTATSTTTLTYTVTDTNGASTSVDFTVMVNAGLALTASGNQNYTRGTAISNLILPAATGGTGTLTYTLTSVPGLTFTASTRTLSGTPSTAGTTTLTYMVTDTNGASTTATFTVMVNAGLALTASGNQNYTEGTAISNLQLPAATGGTAPLTYTLTSVPGLSFNASTRTLSGTPNTAGTTTLTYTVTDTNGASTTATFTVTVNAGLALTASGNQNYTRGTAITALQLPEATGGTGTLTYTLTSVPGLTFTASTRTLSGTPSTAGTTTLTYTVTDTNGASTNATFTVMVNAGLALTASGNQNYTRGTAISNLILPAATGGTGTLVYTLTGTLPTGLSFTAGTRTLSGTPSTATSTTTLTYTVTDTNNASTNATFTVTVNAGLALTASGNQNYTRGTAISNLILPAATGGTGTLVYTLTSVPGLTFTASTRTLSGTPSTAGTTTLTYRVTDTNGASTSATFTVMVNAGLALTASGNQNYTRGTAISNLILPAATGGTGTLTYTLTSVPGLDFNADTRTLSGTPSTAGTTTLTYTVTDTNGASTNATFTVSVSDGLALTASGNQNYTRGTAISNLILPAATGGTGTLTYTLTSVPGLTFTASTRTLSGTPSTAGTTTLTYMVMDTNGASTTATFTVMINAGLALTASGNQNYTRGTAIPDLQLPAATGGTGTLTYTLTSVPGLTFTASTRTLSGTPSTAGTTTLTYTVTDTNGASTNATFTVMVNAGLALTASGNQNYTRGTAISNLILPAATGGTGTLTYTLTSVPGLTFTASTRTLSGTPSTADTTTLTYTVTDTNGASTSVTFTVMVSAGLTLDTPGNQNYTLDTAIPDLQLPAATGGTGTLVYTLTGPGGLPGGLTFTAGTRTLSGTPDTAGTTTLTYSVTSANGASTNATFTVRVSDNTDEGFADLNTLILPEMARAIADQKVSAITQRIAKTMSGGSTRSVTIAGQPTLAEAASAHGQAIADGTLSLKDLLNNSDFVLPLNDAGGTDSGALWGGGSYRSFEGSGGEDVDFDGDLFSAYLGLDTQPRDDLLIGLTLSWSQGNLDYQRSELERKGDYKLDLTSVNPYVGWEVLAGKLDLWATASYGWGDLKINDDGSDQASSYVETWDVAVGGNIQLSQATSPVLFRLKSSALLTEMDVEGSDDIAGLDVDVSLLRMVLEGTDKHLLADGAYVEPSLEVGVRYNGGDGETGFEAELGAGFRYINPIAGLTLEGRARTLVGRDNYNAWGVSGLMLLEQGSNGRGLSFSLSPGYGNTNSGTEKIWKDGLRDEISGDQNYSLRLDTRIGYGLTAPGVRGLLTPYSEMTFGGSDRSYRLGIRWELDSLFDLNLTGERIESNSSTADRAIDRAMLKGNIRF